MKLLSLVLLISMSLFGEVSLDDMMSKRDMQRTGVDKLNYSQKKNLEQWISDNFDEKEQRPNKEEDQLYLSLNIEEGSKLELSDGSVFEIAPEDQIYSAYWITPFPIMLSKSNDPDYPVKITNMNTGTSVKGKRTSLEKVLEEQKKPKPTQPMPQPKMKQKTTPMEKPNR